MSDYIAATTTTDATGITWTSDGYYVVGDPNWQDIVFTSIITYNGGVIGIAPRVYADNMYMTFTLENKTTSGVDGDADAVVQAHAVLNSQVTYDQIHLADKYIPQLVVGNSYAIKAEITGTNYKIYLDDVLIFNIEYSSMAKGQVGVYATTDNKCTNVSVDSAFPGGWTSNVAVVNQGIASINNLDNDDKYMHLKIDTGTTPLYIEQTIDVVSDKPHTLSFNALGSGTASIIEVNGVSPKTYDMPIPDTADWTSYSLTEIISADCTSVKIRFSVLMQELKINSVQFEQKSYATGHIENTSTTSSATRENSLVTYPSKNNIDSKRGSVSLWVKPSITYSVDSANPTPVLFDFSDGINLLRISYTGTAMQFTYGTDTITIDSPFLANDWYHIVATWGENKIGLYVNDTYESKDILSNIDIYSTIIRFGQACDGSGTTFIGAFDEAIVYKNIIDSETVNALYMATEPIEDNASMTMRATFNYSIGNFNKSIMELTPAPQYGSPVLIEKEDGTPLNKVSFFDSVSGEYRTWNEEQVVYDGESDYLVVSYKDIDTENFEIAVKDSNGAQYGMPYRVDGYRVFINLSQDEKDELAGQKLFVSYQINDAYTVDYNIEAPDSFRVNIGKYNGKPISVYYEGNDFQTEKLATMVELNPMLNPNHEGFLYITNNVEKVTSFKAKAAMDDLPANGVSETLVIVEPMDAYGNFISHLQLSVTAEKGTIIPAYDKDSILIRERAGRYLYRYIAPEIQFASNGLLEEEDRIHVVDKETGLGIQIPITLITLQNISHIIVNGDTISNLADKYGVTERDIIAGNKDIENIASYIVSNVGQSINIPLNYSATLMTRTQAEITEEPMIGYLVDKVCEYMDRKADDLPNNLGSVLDFNSDGLINIEEIVWLNDNKLTGNVQVKFTAVKEWEKNNVGG